MKDTTDVKLTSVSFLAGFRTINSLIGWMVARRAGTVKQDRKRAFNIW